MYVERNTHNRYKNVRKYIDIYVRIMYITCENTPNTVVYTNLQMLFSSVLLYEIVKAETKLHNFICMPINLFVHI